ncbi:MAG: plsC [Phycisphaerales bacterium]|nr:plsC [Phycisphaerales bacterium]
MTVQASAVPHRTTAFYKFWKNLCAGVLRVMFDQKNYGLENIPTEGGVLVVSNHVSYLDPAIIAAISPRQFAFLADSGLWTFKPFGWSISRLNAFPVTQGKGDVGAMKKTIALLNDGWALTVFPEGMRTLTGKMMPVQAGAALIIRRTNVPVVPAYIWGGYHVWPKHNLLPRRGHVKVIFRPAMDMSKLGAKEITAELSRVFHEMEAEALERFGPPGRP